MGMFDWYNPSQVAKALTFDIANRSPIVRAATKLFTPYKKPTDQSSKTTEKGSSASAAPSVFLFELLAQRWEKIAIIGDIRRLEMDEPRLTRANKKFAREAVRKGVITSVSPVGATTDAVVNKVRDIIAQVMKDCKINSKLESWARMLPLEGDLFVQIILAGKEIVNTKRMPCDAMDRHTDETDTFIDINNAFSNFDVITQTTLANYAYWEIVHSRWAHIDGERYGRSEYQQIRRIARLLDLLEQGQAIRRMTRAPLRRLHSVGTPDSPSKPTGEGSVEEYRKFNGLANDVKKAWDPLQQTTDYFGNGLVDIKNLEGDGNVEKIDDILHYQNVLMVGCHVPPELMGMESPPGGDPANARAEFLKETVLLSDKIREVLQEIFDFALILQGINPDSVKLTMQFTESNMDTAEDRIDRVIKARHYRRGLQYRGYRGRDRTYPRGNGREEGYGLVPTT